jgi:hypothetical protein
LPVAAKQLRPPDTSGFCSIRRNISSMSCPAPGEGEGMLIHHNFWASGSEKRRFAAEAKRWYFHRKGAFKRECRLAQSWRT